MSQRATLESFDVRDSIGRGGMGKVYRAVHRQTGVPVAIKVIAGRPEASVLRHFHEEVQAQAGLNHPGVVRLYEYGRVGEAVASEFADEIRPGSPYVAMEYAEGGALRECMPIRGWRDLRPILVQVLDALAHAHARGVVHRDLKPENLLVFDGTEGAVVKLADFGIAHAFEVRDSAETDRLRSPMGTLAYMAPEQLRGEWRRYGPWTDLYALACSAWELVCGEPPFGGDTAYATAISHQTAPRPELAPQFGVPDRLEAWLHRAMAIEPHARFQRAADAAFALPDPEPTAANEREHLDRRTPGASRGGDALRRGRPLEVSRARTHTLPEQTPMGDATTAVEVERSETVDVESRVGPGDTAEVESPPGANADRSEPSDLPASRRPMPESWRRTDPEPLPPDLVGTGLGLFGLREPPFVDRDAERDRIWSVLREVETSGAPRVVLALGEAGTGKSRLVEWMARRAHELGTARVLRAVHTPGGEGPREGISGMIERAVRGQRLERPEFHEHLLEVLPRFAESSVDLETDAQALTELVHPTDDDAREVDGPAFRFSSPAQKSALVIRTLRRFSSERPTFVWFDDVQWGEPALDVLAELTDEDRLDPRSLVVATLRSEPLTEDESLRARVADLAARERCIRIDLKALTSEHHRDLVRRMLPLEGELAERLAARTEGNPLFASQLLRHLVDGDQLEVGSEGFRLPEGASLELPRDVHALWIERLERLIGDRFETDRKATWLALERAAAMGREVDAREWSAVCSDVGLLEPDALQTALVDRGLAERTDEGWTFTHRLLVASLERRAREASRWRAHNRAAARLLEAVYPDRPGRTAARRANHWIAADALESALEPLRREIDRLRALGRMRAAQEQLERRADLLDTLEISGADSRRIENDVRIARVELMLGASPQETLEFVRDAFDRAQAGGAPSLAAQASLVIANCHQRMGEIGEACRVAREATTYARRGDEPGVLAELLLRWGGSEALRGELEAADVRVAEAHAQASEIGDRYRRLLAQHDLAWIALSRGHEGRTEELLRTVVEESREAGYRTIEADCYNLLGELERLVGDAGVAREWYRAFARVAREFDWPERTANVHLNLAQVELAAGNYEEAAERLGEAERRFEKLSATDEMIDLLRVLRSALAAARGDWDRYDESLAHYDDGWPEDGRLIRDHPWVLEQAGDLAADAGRRRRAERAWRLARRLRRRLDDEQAAEALSSKIDGPHD